MRKINPYKWLIIISCLLLFLISTQRSNATVIAENIESKAADPVKTIDFNLKREGNKFSLENLKIENTFTEFKSVTISIPKGVQLSMAVPTGWTTSSDLTDTLISYQLKKNNKPADIQKVLEKLSLVITNEKEATGNVSISVDPDDISAWIDPNDPYRKKHYYKFVPIPLSWLDSYNAAKTERYKGLQGYLATITSEEEHDYIFDTIASAPGMLGGTRMSHKNGLKINDEAVLSNQLSNFDTTTDSWYWASGPEAGKIFFTGKHYATGSRPLTVYSGWAKNEPNNFGEASEYVVQFAKNGQKWWNDVDNDRIDTIFNQGYYVEFSQYGKQEEKEGENEHIVALPQRVSVAYIDQETNLPLLSKKESISDTFSLGSPFNTSAFREDIEGYLRIDPTETGSYTGTPQTITYYYTKHQLSFHIQQVILNSNEHLTIPSKGYAEIRNVDAIEPKDVSSIFEKAKVYGRSLTEDGNNYLTSTLTRNLAGKYYQIEGMIPSYYHSLGYVITDQDIPHNQEKRMEGFPTIDSNLKREYWITFYLEPITDSPKPYSQNYQEQNLGEVQ
ncbi:MucBP domain-containing protein [Isobaculum melis]|uniref:MucBP domain-containing protein n=1 Tax=Isobaculum melis TaxID=142588 RepID=A0A1H9Q431_9LACT|nr:MucBP domain-containing protein [Isobaculum melis]SER55178.1 MucBP domain-containing protein [Isobaculum melis]